MNRSCLVLVALALLICSANTEGHGRIKKAKSINLSRLIQFPDTSQYKTIVLDTHTHSSFSDGHVWPRIRVEEALKDGLDALAITEHLEYVPHLNDLPIPDRNRAYATALESNESNALLIIPGVEITRDPPSHHYNALFIIDANTLYKYSVTKHDGSLKKDITAYYHETGKWPIQAVFDEAKQQGAFMIWNHSWWDRTTLSREPLVTPFHLNNIKDNKLQGMEIVNKHSYSAEAFQVAIDQGLTLIGGSDIHELIDWEFEINKGGHRPVTLVLAEDKSAAAVREALFAGRTIVWYKNQLLGLNKNLKQLLDASITISNASYSGKREVLFLEVYNDSDATFQLRNLSQYQLFYNTDIVQLAPHQMTTIAVRTNGRLESISLDFEVLNALTAPGVYAVTNLTTVEIVIKP